MVSTLFLQMNVFRKVCMHEYSFIHVRMSRNYKILFFRCFPLNGD